MRTYADYVVGMLLFLLLSLSLQVVVVVVVMVVSKPYCTLLGGSIFAEVIRVSQQTLTREQYPWSQIIRLDSSHL